MANDVVRSSLSSSTATFRNYRYGLSPQRLLGNEKLSSFFDVLTTSTDEYDQVYVSTVRSRNYPVTGFQWHPEKNAFEWAERQKIPHTEDAILVTQHAANFLVSEGRKSSTRPDEQEVRDNLIYNHKPTYGGKAGKGYDEVYIFA
ncbi:gamma-glutamyl hydrolase 2-like [Neltuma alba]|uniref:gamma-glutamyl hydrolase 2-like n=1 Tax=Neltuma alba TaxID=207710 RepID=UPI0010A355B4|nr:gamma-glutamyl hydrolase 2-like [Prosopis alba]